MKILIISGFLGAGKTTFIKELVKRTHRDFVVLENEFGTAGIDSDRLSGGESKMNVWELTEGCACCTMKDDFASSVLTIANSLDPEYLIVEPTGAASLANLIANLRRIQYEKIVLLKPVTILDYKALEFANDPFEGLVADGIVNAGTVLLSKSEAAEPSETKELCERVKAVNPEAYVPASHYSLLPDEFYFNLLNEYLDPESKPMDMAQEESDLESISMDDISLRSGNELILFLNGVTSGVFGKIVRAKGAVNVGEAVLRFDVVNDLYAITGAADDEKPQAVFIGKDLKRGWLREVLNPAFRFVKIGRAGRRTVSRHLTF